MVDGACADERTAVGVPGDAPRIARAFAEKLKRACAGIEAKHGAREPEIAAALFDVARVEDSVKTIEPAVGTPGERVRQLMCIVASEARDDDFGLACCFPIGANAIKENVAAIRNPNAAITHRDSATN